MAALGLALGVFAPARYLSQGYDILVLISWAGSNLLLFLALSRLFPAGTPTRPRMDQTDWCLLLTLLAIFAPVYLLETFDIPVQVNTDELTISLASEWMSSLPSWDIFSPSDYFAFPSLQFQLFGFLGRLAGGINLHNMRLIHAIFGLSIVAVSYWFLRAVFSRAPAFAGAVLLGSNHALIAISRMAMRDNSALLLELGALAFLVRGLKQGRSAYSYLGGALAGATFYFYEPGRLTMFVWIAGLLTVAVLGRRRKVSAIDWRQVVSSLLAFAAVITPLIAASVQFGFEPEAFHYQREQLLFTPEGLQLQQAWVQADSLAEAVRINILQGLTTFNNRVHDHGYIYFNPGHGFVDSITGVLLWIGLIWGLSRFNGRRSVDALLLAPGLLIPWLVYSFLTIKAPSYTRLLVTLPFVAYYATRGLVFLSGRVGSMLEARGFRLRDLRPASVIAALIVIAIFGWNLSAFADFVLTGIREGEEVGSTGRYVDARRYEWEHKFYLASDENYPYAPYGNDIEPWRWVEWLEFFAEEEQPIEVVPPEIVGRMQRDPPFSVFMISDLWYEVAEGFTANYPNRQVHPLLANGSLLAIEVQPTDDDD